MTVLALRWTQPPPPIVTRWRGASGTLADRTYQSPSALAAIVGPPGPPGGASQIDAIARDDMVQGTPVCLSRLSGQFYPAYASWKPGAFVAGLLLDDVTAGFVGTSTIGLLTLPDWTAIAGAASLTPGLCYFLGATGGITSVPPSSPNCLTQIGFAADAQTLSLTPLTPIQQ